MRRSCCALLVAVLLNCGLNLNGQSGEDKPPQISERSFSRATDRARRAALARPSAADTAFSASAAPGAAVPTLLSRSGLALPVPSPIGLDVRPTLPTGVLPSNAAADDLDGDGNVDLVISMAAEDSVWVYRGNGDGSFQLPTVIRLAGIRPNAVLSVDLRGNGTKDLVVAEGDSMTLGVLLGNGDGTFGPEVLYSVASVPTVLVSADFNQDGKIDIAVGLIVAVPLDAPDQPQFTVFLGDGAGGFAAAVSPAPINRPLDYPSVTHSLAAGDLDGDGFPDLLVETHDKLEGVRLYRNDTHANFLRMQDILGNWIFGTSFNSGTATLGDVNEDGCLDAITMTNGVQAHVFPGACNGSFPPSPSATYSLGDVAYGLGLHDLDGDGHLDLVASGIRVEPSNIGTGALAGELISVLRGDGKGNFGNARVFRGGSSYEFAIADLNHDGRLDIVTANEDDDTANVFLNDGAGGFGYPQGVFYGNNTLAAMNTGVSNLHIDDVNGDGRPDFTLILRKPTTPASYEVATVLNPGSGGFPAPIRSPLDAGLGYSGFVLGDFRNTGKLDLVAVSQLNNPGEYLFAPGLGDGTYGAPTAVPVPAGHQLIAAGDFNYDGKLDFVLFSMPSSTHVDFTVYLGRADGTFAPAAPASYPLTNVALPMQLAVGDFNHDGNLDVSGALEEGSVLLLLHALGKGDGSFHPPQVAYQYAGGFFVADFSHDGRLDLLTYPINSFSPATLFGLWGTAAGGFVPAFTISPYTDPVATAAQASLTPADFNGDGNLDVMVFQVPAITSPQSSTFVRFLAGNGDGTFTPMHDAFPLPGPFFAQYTADVDGDGRADLIELDNYTSSFHVVRGTIGPPAQLSLLANPVLGDTAVARLTLNSLSSADTTATLLSSDPNLSVPSSVVVPAGSLTADIPLSFSSAFDPYKVFTVTAILPSASATLHGTKGDGIEPYGISFDCLADSTGYELFPGETTKDVLLGVGSIDGYATLIQFACPGLSPALQCAFDHDSAALRGASQISNVMTVTAGTTAPAGYYTVPIKASDPYATASATINVRVYDFAVTAGSAPPPALPGQPISVPLAFTFTPTTPVAPGMELYTVCQGLPAATTCGGPIPVLGPNATVPVNTASLAPGDYSFTIVAQNPQQTIQRTAAGKISVAGYAVALDKTTNATTPGGTATVAATVTPINHYSGPILLSCSTAPAGPQCSVTPGSGTVSDSAPLVAAVSFTAPLTIGSSRKPVPLGRPGRSWFGLLAVVALPVLLRRKRALSIGLLLVIVFALGALSSCGGGSSADSGGGPSPRPQPATWTVTVLAQTGGGVSYQKSASFVVSVQ